MSRQYNRQYQLTITTLDGVTKVISGLRVQFTITKSLLSYPNLAEIKIYNANADTLTKLQQKYTKISLSAGYTGNIKVLFIGEVRNIFQSRAGTEKILTIYSGDGQRDWDNSVFNGTFSESVSIKTVINEVIKTFRGLTSGNTDGIPDVIDKLLGQSLSGSSRDIMDTYANEYGFSWSIQDGELVVVDDEQVLSDTDAVLITAATGMIGSPTLTFIGADVTALLNPNLLPNRAFRIDSVNFEVAIGNLFFATVPRTEVTGFYKIQEVTFRGDTRAGDWLSEIKGRIING